MDLEAIHWGVSNLSVSTSHRRVPPLPHQQPSCANSSIVKGRGLHGPLLHSCWAFDWLDLAWVLLRQPQLLGTDVCNSQGMCRSQLFTALLNIHQLFCHLFWSGNGGRSIWITHPQLSTHNCWHLVCWLLMGLPTKHYPPQKEACLTKLEKNTNLWV